MVLTFLRAYPGVNIMVNIMVDNLDTIINTL